MEVINKVNNIKLKVRYSITFYMVCALLFYALFALNRIKVIASPSISGYESTNEVWLIPVIHLLILLFQNKLIVSKDKMFFTIHIFILVIIILIGGFQSINIQQYIYAALIFLVPILLFYSTSRLKYFEIQKLIKIIVLINVFYSIFAIILTTNYSFFMNILGNSTEKYNHYSQYRASMMLGSSITVSYFFNISLPLLFLFFNKFALGLWQKITFLSIVLNVMATILLLSRVSSLISFVIVFYYLFLVKNGTINFKKKVILFIGFITVFFFSLSNYDISRIFMGFNLDGNSAFSRFQAVTLGGHIFSKYPLLGSGMGKYYLREYSDRYITVNGIVGLIDPHNLYILLLSELGLAGFITSLSLFWSMLIKFFKISQKVIRNTAMITLFTIAFNSLGGSHLINEISFSTIFWIIMGIYFAFYRFTVNDSYERRNINT